MTQTSGTPANTPIHLRFAATGLGKKPSFGTAKITA
jgi:hypothetical protein